MPCTGSTFRVCLPVYRRHQIKSKLQAGTTQPITMAAAPLDGSRNITERVRKGRRKLQRHLYRGCPILGNFSQAWVELTIY